VHILFVVHRAFNTMPIERLQQLTIKTVKFSSTENFRQLFKNMVHRLTKYTHTQKVCFTTCVLQIPTKLSSFWRRGKGNGSRLDGMVQNVFMYSAKKYANM